MGKIRTVFHKEFLDNLRDRRSLAAATLFPLLGPAIAGALIMVMGMVASEQTDKPLELPVIGAENAPNLIGFLEQAGAEVIDAPEHPQAAVKAGLQAVVLVIPEAYGAQFRGSTPATVQLIADRSRRTKMPTVRRVERLLEAYSQQVGRLRLLARGIHPLVPDAVVVETIDVATRESRAAMLLAMVPSFIVLAIFLGGIYIAIDTTAGELERGSLEPLFINPVGRWELLTGKLLAVLVFSVVGLLIIVVAFGLLPSFVSTEELGIQIRLDPAMLSRLFFLFLPLTMLASCLQMIVATFSRSFKEAQTHLSFLMLIPVLPGTLLAMVPFEPKTWMMLVPSFSEQILTNRILRGDPVEPLHVGLCFGTTSLLSVIAFALSIQLFTSERLIARE